MGLKKFLRPPIPERSGRDLFVTGVLGGLTVMVMALGGISMDGLLERVCGFFFGVALSVGSGGTLALAYADLAEDSRFAWKIAVRIAFLPLGPLVMAMNFSFFLNEGVWACLALSCCSTIVPFGLSLIWLILKKRNSHS